MGFEEACPDDRLAQAGGDFGADEIEEEDGVDNDHEEPVKLVEVDHGPESPEGGEKDGGEGEGPSPAAQAQQAMTGDGEGEAEDQKDVRQLVQADAEKAEDAEKEHPQADGGDAGEQFGAAGLFRSTGRDHSSAPQRWSGITSES